MQISQGDIEAIWREAWITAPDGANTFNVELTNRWLAARNANKAGSLTNITHSGASHAYAPQTPDTRNTVYIERAQLDALKLYEHLQTVLDVDQDEAGELAIYNEGIALFVTPPSEFTSDFSLARQGASPA